ncbi:MAG: hypothetical protein AAFR38_02660 [Planctomycetota bacterium]
MTENDGASPGTSTSTAPSATESGRDASLVLERQGETRGDSAMMDPANQSLADALRIMYRLVLVVMVVLAVVFLGSGFRTVGEGEVGISLLFGEPMGDERQPGAVIGFPMPMGELVRVEREANGGAEMRVDTHFWPNRRDPDAEPVRSGAPQSLDPLQIGSLITSDINLAHLQLSFNYRREDAKRAVETISRDHEENLVRSVLHRAIVHEVAGETIDGLLRTTSKRDLSDRIREHAQAKLDDLGSGLELTQVNVYRTNAPFALLQTFQLVQLTRSDSAERETAARSLRSQRLTDTAGEAAEPLLDRIAAYEVALAGGDPEEADQLLRQIDRLLAGDPVEIDGEIVNPDVSGEVTRLIANAENLRVTLRESERGRLELYEAMLEQYRRAPGPMIAQSWSQSWREFMDKDFVQVMRVPPGSQPVLRLNTHPELAAQAERNAKRAQAQEAASERESAAERARFEQETGRQRGEDG